MLSPQLFEALQEERKHSCEVISLKSNRNARDYEKISDYSSIIETIAMKFVRNEEVTAEEKYDIQINCEMISSIRDRIAVRDARIEKEQEFILKIDEFLAEDEEH